MRRGITPVSEHFVPIGKEGIFGYHDPFDLLSRAFGGGRFSRSAMSLARPLAFYSA
jgi:hypothetical protein